MTPLIMSIAEQIEDRGFAVIDGWMHTDTADALLSDVLTNYQKGDFDEARIGKGIEKKRIEEIRGDSILWLNPSELSEYQTDFWNSIEELAGYLSGYFRVNLRRFECHYAVYPEGSFYIKHVDQFQNSSNRIFSFVYYLNRDWKKGDGGELRIYKGSSHTDVEPAFNRLCCFRSDNMEHEVLITNRKRISVTGWIRRD